MALIKFIGRRAPHDPKAPVFEDRYGEWAPGRIHNVLDDDERIPFWLTTKAFALATPEEFDAQALRDAGQSAPPVKKKAAAPARGDN